MGQKSQKDKEDKEKGRALMWLQTHREKQVSPAWLCILLIAQSISHTRWFSFSRSVSQALELIPLVCAHYSLPGYKVHRGSILPRQSRNGMPPLWWDSLGQDEGRHSLQHICLWGGSKGPRPITNASIWDMNQAISALKIKHDQVVLKQHRQIQL